MTTAILAALLGGAGAWGLYLASPQQQWRAQGHWPRARWPAVVALAASLALLLSLMGPAAACFTWLTLVMLVGSAAPFAGAWRARSRGCAHG
ncbi:MAG: hypothetical protein LCH73_04485 [Proteobacteria bacterium]|nr:hypothetical protein [Pseudomonadota bacterium]